MQALSYKSQDWTDNDKQVFGLYTGFLVSSLTEKNRLEGKETIIHVKDAELDYMFYGVKNADTIIVENCKGNNILLMAGIDRGDINSVVLQNNEGDKMGVSMGIGYGNVSIAVIQNIEGDNAGCNCGIRNGNIGFLIIKDIKGKKAGLRVGNDTGFYTGGNDKLIIQNVSDMGVNIHDEGSESNVFTFLDNVPKKIFGRYGYNVYNKNFLLIDNIEREELGRIRAERIIHKKENPEEFDITSKNLKIPEVLGLVDSINGETPEEINNIIKEIQEVSKTNLDMYELRRRLNLRLY